MKTKKSIIFWIVFIIIVLGVATGLYFYCFQGINFKIGPGNSGPKSFDSFLQYAGDEANVEQVYLNYLKAGKNCDMDLAYSIISEKSKEIVHFTCSNMANETKCYRGRDYEVKINGDNAIVYLSPFSYKVENPFFFTRENGEWKLDLYKMWAGLVMIGSTCDSGWSWRDFDLREEFCSYQIKDSQCPNGQ